MATTSQVKLALLVAFAAMAVAVLAEPSFVSEHEYDTESDNELLRDEFRIVKPAQSAINMQKGNGGAKSDMLPNPLACAKYFDFVRVPAGNSMYFRSPVNRKKTYPSKLNCGWWFWTMYGYHLEVRCKYIVMRRRDYFFLYDNSTSEWTEFTKTKKGRTTLKFQSSDVAAGIYSDKRNGGKGFSCMVSSVRDYVKPTTPRPTTTEAPPEPSDTCTCGVYQSVTRITNGTEAEVGEYRWIAGLTRSSTDPFYFCGASIVTKTHVVTAAHCLNSDTSIPLPYVTVGMHSQTTDGSYTIVPALEQTIHPMYSTATLMYDIAVMRVPPLTFSDRVGPVCLPDDLTVDYAGQMGTAAGWGVNSTGGSPDVLMEVAIRVLPNDLCDEMYGPGSIYDVMMCAADLDNGGEDSCQGDSGGPFIVNDNGSAELIGIVSWGIGCGNVRYPGVYARVTEMVGFIYDNTRGAEFCGRNPSSK